MRVLITSAPLLGHVAPMFGVARALRDAGHDVRVATHPSLHPVIAKEGLTPVAAGISGPEVSQERPRRWPETVGQPVATWAVRMFTEILAPSTLADLTPFVAQWRPDLVVHEEGEYAGPVVAAEAGIPCVTHGWGSPLRPSEDLVQLEHDAAPLWTRAGLAIPPRAGLYGQGLINPCPWVLQPTAASTTWTAWPVRPGTLTATAAGSGAGTNQGAGTAEAQERVDVYVGFGTVPAFADNVTLLAAAVRACTTRGRRTLVTTGNDEIAHQLRALGQSQGEPVIVRRFVSLEDTLATCELAVCHGGAGTVLAALTAGVPLVVVATGSPSQARMAQACAAAGLGAVAEATPEGIDVAVAQVLSDPSYRNRARTAAEEIRAMPAPTDLAGPLEALVAERTPRP